MRIISLAGMRAKLGAYIDKCATEGPIVITRNGKTAAVLLAPRDDDDLERILLGRSQRFQAMLDHSRRSIEEGRGLSEEAFWRAARERAQERKPSPRRPNRRGDN